jgi:hypothetical protein
MGESTSNEGSATTEAIALPNRDSPDVTRFKAAAAKRVQAHRARARLGLRCLTVRVSDRTVRHLISTRLPFHGEQWGKAGGRVRSGSLDFGQCPLSKPDGDRSARAARAARNPRRVTNLRYGRWVSRLKGARAPPAHSGVYGAPWAAFVEASTRSARMSPSCRYTVPAARSMSSDDRPRLLR